MYRILVFGFRATTIAGCSHQEPSRTLKRDGIECSGAEGELQADKSLVSAMTQSGSASVKENSGWPNSDFLKALFECCEKFLSGSSHLPGNDGEPRYPWE